MTLSDDPTSSATPFAQFTDNDGSDYDKRLNSTCLQIYRACSRIHVHRLFPQAIGRPTVQRCNLAILKRDHGAAKGRHDHTLQLDGHDGREPKNFLILRQKVIDILVQSPVKPKNLPFQLVFTIIPYFPGAIL